MIETATLRAAGTSPAAIAHHYDLPPEFFARWLGEELVYSCALWFDGEDAARDLAAAQQRKLDFFAQSLCVREGNVLDVGCGWGALLDRCVRRHGAASGVGLTLSASQVAVARARRVPGVDYRLESWVDHRPRARYDAISCIEATEHWASDRLDVDAKVAVYRSFFERCAEWLVESGRLGLQLICLDNVGHEGSRAGRSRSSELIRVDIFPESMPASLSEMVLGWETQFELVRFHDHSDHYARTFRAWALGLRSAPEQEREPVDAALLRTFARYFATGEMYFRRREHALYRVLLKKRPRPKVWVRPLQPSELEAPGESAAGASPTAVQAHYDLSNAFYRLWLGPSMMYTSGLWMPGDDETDLDAAHERKIGFFARRLLPTAGMRVLDVGCGWGHVLRQLVATHGAAQAVGLTLSPAQRDHAAGSALPSVEVRVEDWAVHRPTEPYDAILSFGAFEHFARDGSSIAQRVRAYQRFFARCFEWLCEDGRLALETITHDNAPDTATPRGRGPLGDLVLELFPESLCPHLGEIVLGFEPWFEVELLRLDAADFARTFRLWHLALRARETEAAALVGADIVRRFRAYLASSEVQFRSGALTNVRVVLHRRPKPRW